MKCDICNSDSWKKGEKLVTCETCGFVRAKNEYYSKSPQDIYTKEYYKQGDYFDYGLEEAALRKNFKNRLAIVRKYVKGGDLLEVGCAYGFFLDDAKKNFDVEGIERDPETANAVTKKLGVYVFGGDFLNFETDKKYDAIVALDVIEHISSPKAFVQKCHDLLKPGGYLFLETGDVGSFLPKKQGENWRLVYPPVHLSYLSEDTLKKLLKRNHFENIEIRRVWFWRTLAQTVFKFYPNKFKNPNGFLPKLFSKVIFPVNTFDLVFVVAKKT